MDKPTSKKSRKGITVSEAFSDNNPQVKKRFKKKLKQDQKGKKGPGSGSDGLRDRGQGTVQSIRRVGGTSKAIYGVLKTEEGEFLFFDQDWLLSDLEPAVGANLKYGGVIRSISRRALNFLAMRVFSSFVAALPASVKRDVIITELTK